MAGAVEPREGGRGVVFGIAQFARFRSEFGQVVAAEGHLGGSFPGSQHLGRSAVETCRPLPISDFPRVERLLLETKRLSKSRTRSEEVVEGAISLRFLNGTNTRRGVAAAPRRLAENPMKKEGRAAVKCDTL
ncbi:MAG: hypothetical protein Kow00109_19440 [Acidobacteriota bacterium]